MKTTYVRMRVVRYKLLRVFQTTYFLFWNMLTRIHTGIPGKGKIYFLSARSGSLPAAAPTARAMRRMRRSAWILASHSSHSSSPKARPCWSHSLATAAQASSTLRPSASSAKNLLMASFFFFYLAGLQASL